jgi:hypothetical protein
MPTETTINQLRYDGLWCYIGGSLDVNDDEAKEIANKFIDQGITTWEQFSELDANEIGSMIH